MLTTILLNPLAIAAVTIGAMVIGFLYYSPLVLGKPWMKEMGYTKKVMAKMRKETNMGATYFLALISALVTAIVMSGFIDMVGAKTLGEGALIGALAWLGFAATSAYTTALFTRKSMSLYAIDMGNQLLAFVMMGAVLAVW